MSVLETFFLVLKADAGDLKKGTDEAKKAADDTEKALVDTDKAAEKLGGSFLDMITNAQGAIAGLVSIGAIAGAAISEAARTDALGKFADSIGVAIGDVDAWGEAAIRAGGSAEGFQGSLQALTENLTDLTLTGGGPAAEVFARLGVNALDAGGKVRDAFAVLPELAESFEGLSKQQSLALGQKLGLDQGTIQLLQQGRVAVEEQVRRQRELGVATEESFAASAKFNDAWADTQQVFGDLARQVGITLLPAFTSILGGVQKVVGFLRDNKELVTGFFIGAAGVITYLYLPAALAAAAATLTALAPFIAIGLAITAVGAAFALLYDDIQAFLAGGDSVIGQVSQKWPIVGETIKGIIWAAKTLFEVFSKVASFFAGLFTDSIKSAFGYLKGFLGFGDDMDKTIEAVKKGEIELKQAAGEKTTAQNAQQITSTANQVTKNTQVSVEKVNVDARGGDSKEIAAGVGDALRDQVQSTMSNYDDAVAM